MARTIEVRNHVVEGSPGSETTSWSDPDLDWLVLHVGQHRDGSWAWSLNGWPARRDVSRFVAGYPSHDAAAAAGVAALRAIPDYADAWFVTRPSWGR